MPFVLNTACQSLVVQVIYGSSLNKCCTLDLILPNTSIGVYYYYENYFQKKAKLSAFFFFLQNVLF